jgi:hypothetical protein
MSWATVSRIAASIFGGYAFVWGFTTPKLLLSSANIRIAHLWYAKTSDSRIKHISLQLITYLLAPPPRNIRDAIRSCPQSGFSAAILRITCRSATGIGGRPALHFLLQIPQAKLLRTTDTKSFLRVSGAQTLHRLRLPGQQRTFRICESDPLVTKARLQHPILGLKELDDDQLPAVNPPRHDHQEKHQQ